jgi:hypothetical protein
MQHNLTESASLIYVRYDGGGNFAQYILPTIL